ncbi:MAG TPA: DinB family protein [Vicinamibacterales bacterium]|nr:DinB family protein [Vicinamibacterales bacterium]
MKRIFVLSCVLVLSSAIPALAQKALAEAMARSAAGTFRNLVESAEKMPEADYTFQATKDTRTFGAFVGHTINSAYNNCSRAKGEANPNKEDLEKVTSKATLVAAAKAVQAYCDAVYAAQTDASLSEMIALGQQQGPRGQALIGVISHNMNEYGQMVILMRHKGVVPPTTERAQAPRKPGQE